LRLGLAPRAEAVTGLIRAHPARCASLATRNPKKNARSKRTEPEKHEPNEQMKTNRIHRTKVETTTLYRIDTGHTDPLTLVIARPYGAKPTPRIYTGTRAPMLTLSRANVAQVFRAARKGEG